MKSKPFRDAMEKQNSGYSFSIYSQFLNITVWKDSGLVYFVDNDFDGDDEKYIAAKVNDKRNQVYSGYRKVNFLDSIIILGAEYKAKEVTRAYRMSHNFTDIENSRKAVFNIDFRTKRKNMFF